MHSVARLGEGSHFVATLYVRMLLQSCSRRIILDCTAPTAMPPCHARSIICARGHNPEPPVVLHAQCYMYMYQAKGEKVEIYIFVQVNELLIAEMLIHHQK